MSPINFVDLANERPDLANVWNRFADWAASHPKRKIIDPQALARFLQDVSPENLIDACRAMVGRGLLRQAFMVESQDGDLIGGVYNTPLDIPETVSGRFEARVPTADAKIVPVFVEENAGEQ